jgi:hypothetical protein
MRPIWLDGLAYREGKSDTPYYRFVAGISYIGEAIRIVSLRGF